MKKAIIAICTCRRPKMLAACIESITKQNPLDWKISILIVENDTQGHCKDIALSFDKKPFPVKYVLETDRGIPQARNRVMKEVKKMKSPWVICIDDDEIAKERWLEALLQEANRNEVDVIRGYVKRSYPDKIPAWLPPQPENPKYKNREMLTTSATSNVMFKTDFNLKFNESRRFSGGEDIEYFREAYNLGKKIIFINNSIVEEIVPPERLTLKWHLRRAFQSYFNSLREEVSKKGYLTIFRYLPQSIRRIISTLVIIPLIPFIILIHWKDKEYQKILFRTAKRFIRGIVPICVILNIKIYPYRNPEGY